MPVVDGVISSLDPHERSAVVVALNDAGRGHRTAPTAKGFRRTCYKLYLRLTGHVAPQPLANPRLEAIRRFAEVTRRAGRVAETHVSAMRKQGFSRAQIDAITALSA
ncbi:MAG TPA: hypothetical protein VKQ27_16895 [Acetobacteraceae bacterium]|nr:hypothetical protein [Acetobacteraceae bacterium]